MQRIGGGDKNSGTIVAIYPIPVSICGVLSGHIQHQQLTTVLQRVSQELDYRIDICRVTKGAHIEHL
jgi:hypothetical protein